MAKEFYKIRYPLSFVIHSLSKHECSPWCLLENPEEGSMFSYACAPWTVRDGSLSTHLLLLFCLLVTCLRQHSGKISSMLDSSSSFSNSKAFLQTCLKNDIIYIIDCFTYLCKCENHYINQKSYALYFPFIAS